MALVLVVDDERIVALFVRVALEYAGHKVVTAGSESEAHAAAAAVVDRVELLIIEPRVPGSGRNIAEQILITHPQMKVLHMSGWPQAYLESLGSLLPGAAFLAKPFTAKKIHAAVAELLAA